MADRLRIQILVDRPRHAQARIAHAISRCLADEFRCRVRYESGSPDLADWPCDLLLVMSWDSTWHRQFGFRPQQVVKSVLDHVWDRTCERMPGGADGEVATAQFVERWLGDADTITCCSERLRSAIEPLRPVFVTRPGFDPFVFPSRRAAWRGPPKFGWAGDKLDRAQGYRDIVVPAARRDQLRIAVSDGDPQLAAIGAFFRSIDVFVLASEQEGAPLTLIEALASGCFAVCVDVGVVPEWIEHGVNGLIVPRRADAFEDAFAWCERNVDSVRREGSRGAERMRHRLTWEHVAEDWRTVFRSALSAEPEVLLVSAEPPKIRGPLGDGESSAAPMRPVERIGVLSDGAPSAATPGAAFELAAVRDVLDHNSGLELATVVPLSRAPNAGELDQLKACDRLIACAGNVDLPSLLAAGGSALSTSSLTRIQRPVSVVGARVGQRAGTRSVRSLLPFLNLIEGDLPALAAADEDSANWLAELAGHNPSAVVAAGPSARLLGESSRIGVGPDSHSMLMVLGPNTPTDLAVLDRLCAMHRPDLLVIDVAGVDAAFACAKRYGLEIVSGGNGGTASDLPSSLPALGAAGIYSTELEVAIFATGAGLRTGWIVAAESTRCRWSYRVADWLRIPRITSPSDPRSRSTAGSLRRSTEAWKLREAFLRVVLGPLVKDIQDDARRSQDVPAGIC